ncbi:MAG: galactokinase [Flavobacteriaceae bacterium]
MNNPELSIASPGRVNLIGEHTDYNEGFVLPTAIDKYIVFHFRINHSQSTCNVLSKNYGKSIRFDLKKITKSKSVWENFVLGVLDQLQRKTNKIRGFDCVIESALPMGSGVSSSAALECGLAYGLNILFSLGLEKYTLIKLCQMAEHEFVGTKCGIMDQFASVMSKSNTAILLDCKTLEHEYVPLELGTKKILLINTNVSHSLAESEYNARRTDCEVAVEIIRKKYPKVFSLRDVTMETLIASKGMLSETHYQRCEYIVNENERVKEAVTALKNNDFEQFGRLMYASHEGLKNKYEVSCKELDFLVDFSKNHDTVIGSRMMGGGFGGCTINIIESDGIDDYVRHASKAYENKFGIGLDSFEIASSKGTHVLASIIN